MLPTILHTLEPLASSRAFHLIVGLYISGTLLLACPDDRLLTLSFLVQRGIVIVLLWSSLGLYLAATSAVASVAVALIYLITVWRLYRKAGAVIARSTRGALPLTHLPFRALAAALAVLLTYGLLQRYTPPLLPPLVSSAVAWLLVEFCFALLLAANPLPVGLGVLAFADAGRILCALTQPDPLLWGLWASCDVLVALAAAHLHTVEITAYGGADPYCRARRDRTEVMEVCPDQDAAAIRPEIPTVEETKPNAATQAEPTVSSALSAAHAVETGPSAQPRPEAGDTA